MSNPYPLQAIEISRKYGNYQALAPASFILQPGEAAVLTGPNGAGKTTLLNCLSGLIRPTTGAIFIEGYDLYADERQARRALAFVPDVPRFYTELTAWEHLQFTALAHDAEADFASRAGNLLGEFGLWEARNLYPHNYSRGMRLKLGLLLALIRPFKVLLMDEPTSALDSESVELLISRLASLCRQGAAVLLSTHNPVQTETLAARHLELRNCRLEEA